MYANGDPVNKWDPSGNFSLIELAVVVAVILILATQPQLKILVLADDFLSKPLTVGQRKEVSSAINYIRAKGFGLEAFALSGANIKLSFAFNIRPKDIYPPFEDDYATTFPIINKVVLLGRFFQSLGQEGGFTNSDVERAAILLHESYHLLGGGEHSAYRQIWQNREQLGFTEALFGETDAYKAAEQGARTYAPELFK